jgi:transforming growth factor-beta-induced protein
MKCSVAAFASMIIALLAVLSITRVSAQPAQPRNSILDVADQMDNLSTLLDLATDEDLLYAIDGTSGTNVTVFAPTNDAFAALAPTELATNLMTKLAWGAHLSDLLQNHIIVSVLPSGSVTTNTTVTTLAGDIVEITVGGPNITVGGANVITTDIIADNGIIHVIDSVITPAWWDQTLPTAASKVNELSTLVGLLESAGLVSILSAANSTFTILAPTSDAFTGLDATFACVTSNSTILTAVLTYHVVMGVVPASQAMSGTFETLEGSIITLDVGEVGTPSTINGGAAITKTDALLANNGIVHYINAVLVPNTVASLIADCVNATTRAPVSEMSNPPVATPSAKSSGAVLVDWSMVVTALFAIALFFG